MPQFPIHVVAKPYRGSKQKLMDEYSERIQIAARITEYINSKEDPRCQKQIFTYSEIADKVDAPLKVVRLMLMGICGGNTGISMIPRQDPD